MPTYINSVPIHTDKSLSGTNMINWKKICLITILGIAGSIGGIASGIVLSGVKNEIAAINNNEDTVKRKENIFAASAKRLNFPHSIDRMDDHCSSNLAPRSEHSENFCARWNEIQRSKQQNKMN